MDPATIASGLTGPQEVLLRMAVEHEAKHARGEFPYYIQKALTVSGWHGRRVAAKSLVSKGLCEWSGYDNVQPTALGRTVAAVEVPKV